MPPQGLERKVYRAQILLQVDESGSDAFIATTQKNVTGAVKLSLYKGNVNVVSRTSPFSLYRTDIASFTMGDSYDQKDAEGFIRILGLPARSQAWLRQQLEGTEKRPETVLEARR